MGTDDIENMTGVRPGPYWQIMWRFISPALMSAVIASSIYFMLTNNPKYSAWNKEQAKSEDREYSHTGLVFAAILAISSLIPIAGGAILHVVRRLQNENYYQSSVIHRVDTNASTHPMMSNFEEFHDLPVGADDSNFHEYLKGICPYMGVVGSLILWIFQKFGPMDPCLDQIVVGTGDSSRPIEALELVPSRCLQS